MWIRSALAVLDVNSNVWRKQAVSEVDGARVSESVATQLPGSEAQHILGGTKSQETTCNFGYLVFCKNTLIGGIFSPLESTFVSN